MGVPDRIGVYLGYFATVSIGTPAQNFTILMDTGSVRISPHTTVSHVIKCPLQADFWVPSSTCKSCGTSHPSLGNDSSSTFKASTQSFSVSYGTSPSSPHPLLYLQLSSRLTFCQAPVRSRAIWRQILSRLPVSRLTNHIFGVTSQETSNFSAARPHCSMV